MRKLTRYAVPVLVLSIGALVAFAAKPWREADDYRRSIRVVMSELDRLQAERHRIAGLPPPKDHYANVRTQAELETLDARQNEIANAIAKRVQNRALNAEALAALQSVERKISLLRFEFEGRRSERLERFARPPVQRGCRWMSCPDPLSLPGEAAVLHLRAENPDFGKTPARIPTAKRR